MQTSEDEAGASAGPSNILPARSRMLPQQDLIWIEARRRFRLSHAQVQMARELGLNPRKFGKIANHRQEPWKEPLPQFIERLYRKRFGRDRPAVVLTIEERAGKQEAKRPSAGWRRGESERTQTNE